MPDTPTTPDDPFADLYGKLPHPRDRGGDVSGGRVPASRREARAARQGSGDTAPTTRPVAPDPAPLETPPRPPAPRTPAAHAAAQAAPTAVSTRPAATAGTLDDLFTGTRSTDEVGFAPPPKRRRRRVGGWIAFGIVLAVIGGLVVGGMWALNTYGPRVQEYFAGTTVDDFDAGAAYGEAQITIAAGDAGPQVSEKLFAAGVTKTETSLYDYMIEENIAFTFQPGVFQLQLEMTSPAVLEELRDPESRLENTAQLREGLTVEQSVAVISEQMGMPAEELQAAVDADPATYGVAADSLEGWLFPATYTFDPGATATDVVRTMVDRTVQSLDAAGVPGEERQRILTIASIIQREARYSDDFYRVSRVIQNRLDPGNEQTNGLLQMDSTAQYGYGELHDGTASSSAEALADDNPWNTYVYTGLPIGPISNPGDLAIDAAMNPVDGPWFYFVTVNLDTGETVFTNTADEHQAAADQWIAWCQDNPDSGC